MPAPRSQWAHPQSAGRVCAARLHFGVCRTQVCLGCDRERIVANRLCLPSPGCTLALLLPRRIGSAIGRSGRPVLLARAFRTTLRAARHSGDTSDRLRPRHRLMRVATMPRFLMSSRVARNALAATDLDS
jgi:hypothetical protein